MADHAIDTDIITLTRYLTEQEHKLPTHATGDFTYAHCRYIVLVLELLLIDL